MPFSGQELICEDDEPAQSYVDKTENAKQCTCIDSMTGPLTGIFWKFVRWISEQGFI